MRLFARRFDVHDAAKHRIEGDDADHHAVHSCKLGDHGAPETRLDFEDGAAVDDQFDQPAHVIGLALRARDDGGQRVFAAIDWIAALRARRQFPDVGGHIRQETPDLPQAVVLILGCVVDGAGGVDRHFMTAQFFLRDLGGERALDDGRPGGENLAVVFHHHRPVRKNRAPGRAAGGGAHHRAHHRHDAHQFDRALEAVRPGAGKRRVAAPRNRSDAAADPIDEIDERDAIEASQVFDKTALTAFAPLAAEAGAPLDRVILAADGYRAAVNGPDPRHIGRGHEGRQLAGMVVARLAGKLADLLKRAGIEHCVDPFAYRQLASGVVARDRGGAAALIRHAAPAVDFVDFRFPAHAHFLGGGDAI